MIVGLIAARSVARAKPVPLDAKCRKDYRRAVGNLQIAMDATLATWEEAKRAGWADIVDIQETIANPEASVSQDALKSGALVKAGAIAASLEDERERNLAEVKAFKRQSVGASRRRSEGSSSVPPFPDFKEMGSAKWPIWQVWTASGKRTTPGR